MKQKQNYSQLFNPRSIAVIGASSTKGKVGNMIARNITSHKYDGDVFFVNPKRDKILGKKCYKSLIDIKQSVDCTIVVVPGKFVEQVIRESIDVCKNFVVISAGFGETGMKGHNMEMSLNALAMKENINILGPNCLGFLTPSIGLNASFAEGLPAEGKTAVISQSGALAVAIMDKAREENIGFSSVVSIGNKMQIGAAELIEYFRKDKNTDTIALYLEGVNRGTLFLEAISNAVNDGKKVIILKAGVTQEAQEAIALHTGSLAGSDDIFSAALKKVGGVRANSMSEFFALIRFAQHYKSDIDGVANIGIVTNAGGPGVLATDVVASVEGVEMSKLEKNTRDILKKKLPEAASVHNPVDLLGDATLDRYEIGIKKMISDKSVDVILVLLTPQDQTPVKEVAKLVIELQAKTKKLIITSFIGGERVRGAIEEMNAGGVLHFISPRVALTAVSAFVRKRDVYNIVKKPVSKERSDKVSKIIENASGQESLYFQECADIAKMYNIPMSKFWDVTNGLDAEMKIKYPCVVKVDNPNVLHKTDRGGVLLPINNLKELIEAREILLNRFEEDGTRVIAQPMLKIKTELIIGLKRDSVFGVVIVAGFGGIYTEVFNKVNFYISPLTTSEIKNTLRSGALSFLFDGTRGEESYNLNSIADIIYNMALMGSENSKIVAIDINPLLVYNDDKPDVAVDFKIVL
ncbi:MAG: acetate--CoA ligase family protein [Candidatus Moraniibacteriota bacterium]|jgi:acetate---CoA ligase (ADP-forming)